MFGKVIINGSGFLVLINNQLLDVNWNQDNHHGQFLINNCPDDDDDDDIILLVFH